MSILRTIKEKAIQFLIWQYDFVIAFAKKYEKP